MTNLDKPSRRDDAGSGPSPSHHATGLVCDLRFKKHLTGRGHPECPDRIDAVLSGLESKDGKQPLEIITPAPAPAGALRSCHTDAYLELAEREIAAGFSQLSTGDTTVCKDSWEVALLAVGGALSAVDAVVERRLANAFCAVRPPGHHATPGCGMGFCVLNNIAIAARYAQAKHGLGKILIADWDVHHGNGTQDVFYEDDSVLFFSTHQSPWYPGTGAAAETGRGKGLGFTINCPLPAGSGRGEIFSAFHRHLLPAVDTFRPELVLVSAGFDSRRSDPLGMFQLDDEDFAELTQLLLQVADVHAGGRLVSFLEGGYSLQGLALAARAHVAELCGGKAP